ncbi:MAG: OmpW family outer membrane protein [Pseudomonadales bacterium]
MKTISITAIISTVVLTALPLTAISHQQGDLIVRAGAATVDPNNDSSLIYAAGAGLAGTGVGLNSDTQVGITVSYMLTNNWGIELLAATPFEHDVAAQGLGGFGVSTLGTVEHLPPTLSLQYYFTVAAKNFHPYVGAGINYTLILDESLSSEAKTGLGATSMDIDDSVGLALQAGFDYELDKNWMINVSVWKVSIETEAKIVTSNAFNPITVDLDIDPWVYMIGAAYKF